MTALSFAASDDSANSLAMSRRYSTEPMFWVETEVVDACADQMLADVGYEEATVARDKGSCPSLS
jgi:hypothetical protein